MLETWLWHIFGKKTFPKGEYNKLKLKKIEPYKILRKFSSNAYEIELPKVFGISPIFNVSNLYPFKETINDPIDAPTNTKFNDINNYLQH